MDFPYGLALDLLFRLFLDRNVSEPKQPPQLNTVQAVKLENPRRVDIPAWATAVPENCFIGISRLCDSIGEARNQAVDSAITQILQSMGAEYRLSHQSTLSSDGGQTETDLEEHLAYTSKWFLHSVQQNIKKTHIQHLKGEHICFVLVEFPPERIEHLRKLTIGPRVGARVVAQSGNHIDIEVIENNGVRVDLTGYEIQIKTTNRHAGIITMFAFKVPDASVNNHQGVFKDRVSLCESSELITLPTPSRDNDGFAPLILGSKDKITIIIHGHDEIGQPICLIIVA